MEGVFPSENEFAQRCRQNNTKEYLPGVLPCLFFYYYIYLFVCVHMYAYVCCVYTRMSVYVCMCAREIRGQL